MADESCGMGLHPPRRPDVLMLRWLIGASATLVILATAFCLFVRAATQDRDAILEKSMKGRRGSL